MFRGAFPITPESDLKQTDRVELVTTPPDVETNFNTYEPDIDIEYDTDTEDIAHSSGSSSTSRYPQAVCDDDDYLIECPSNRNIKICNKQMCDRVQNCPNGEDENPEQCSVGEWKQRTMCGLMRTIYHPKPIYPKKKKLIWKFNAKFLYNQN